LMIITPIMMTIEGVAERIQNESGERNGHPVSFSPVTLSAPLSANILLLLCYYPIMGTPLPYREHIETKGSP